MNLLELLPQLADVPLPIVLVQTSPISGQAKFFKPHQVELVVDGAQPVTREITAGARAISVLLHDRDLQSVLLVEEPAAGAAYRLSGESKPYRYVGLLCGQINNGEDARAAVLREVAEETGLGPQKIQPDTLLPITPQMSVAATVTAATIQLFCVRADLRELRDRQFKSNPWRGEAGEFVRPWVVPVDMFLQIALDSKKGPNSMTCVMAAQWLATTLPHLHRLAR